MLKLKSNLFLLLFSFCFCSGSVLALDYQEQTIVRKVAPVQRALVCGSFERPIFVAGSMNYPPIGWKETYKKASENVLIGDEVIVPVYHGIGAKLFQRFAKEYKLHYQYINFLNTEDLLYALSYGRIDLALDNYYNLNSYSNLSYIYPGYLTNPIVIVSLKPTDPNKKIQKLSDLTGKKGLVREEEHLYDMIYRKMPEDVELTKTTGASKAFTALLEKKVDFLIMSRFAYEAESARFKVKNYLTFSDEEILSPVIFFSYVEGNPCSAFLKKEFSKKIKEYSSDPAYMRSLLTGTIREWESKFLTEKSLMFKIQNNQSFSDKKTD